TAAIRLLAVPLRNRIGREPARTAQSDEAKRDTRIVQILGRAARQPRGAEPQRGRSGRDLLLSSSYIRADLLAHTGPPVPYRRDRHLHDVWLGTGLHAISTAMDQRTAVSDLRSRRRARTKPGRRSRRRDRAQRRDGDSGTGYDPL